METVTYHRIEIRCGDHHFSLFCTQKSLEYRREEILLWADKLARRLHWQTYETTISSASVREANERPHALFEHRFPTPS